MKPRQFQFLTAAAALPVPPSMDVGPGASNTLNAKKGTRDFFAGNAPKTIRNWVSDSRVIYTYHGQVTGYLLTSTNWKPS
jgi:hypothetical protein